MKKIALHFIFFVLFFSLISVLASSNRIVRVGIYQNKPLVFTDKENTPRGIYIDILKYVAAREDWTLEYVISDWPDCLDGLANHKIDLLVAIAYSKERSTQLDFSKETVLINYGKIFVPRNSKIQAITDLQNKTIAVLSEDIYYAKFRQMLSSFGLSARFLELDSYREVLSILDKKRADAGILTRLLGLQSANRYNVLETPILFAPVELRFAVPRNADADLIQALDNRLHELKKDRNSVYYRSMEHWFSQKVEKEFPIWLRWLLVGAAVLAVVFLVTSLVLKAQVNRKTSELIEKNQELQAQIQKRKWMEQSLRRSEVRYRSLFENVPVSLWEEDYSDLKIFFDQLKARGIKDYRNYFDNHPQAVSQAAKKIKILDVNKCTLDLFEVKDRKEFFQSLEIIFGEEARHVFKEELIALAHGKNHFEAEVMAKTVTGERKFIAFNLIVAEGFEKTLGRVLVSIADITDRVRTEKSLQQSEQKFRSLVEKSIDSIILVNEHGRVVEWNQGAERIYGQARKNVVGKFIWDVQFQLATSELKEEWKFQMVRSEMLSFHKTGRAPWVNRLNESEIILADGKRRVIQSVVFPIPTGTGFMAGSVARDITARIQSENQVKKALLEKEILLKEIHHRVKNNLQIISSLLRLQSFKINDSQFTRAMLDSQSRIRSMALIHERLYQSEDFSNIEFGIYARKLVADLFRTYQVDLQAIQFDIQIENVSLDVNTAIPCGLVINELVSNALKYAFPNSFRQKKLRPPKIEIALLRLSSGRYELQVSDNGVGLSPELDIQKTSSLGLRLVTILVKDQLGGNLTVDRSNGTAFQIIFNDGVSA